MYKCTLSGVLFALTVKNSPQSINFTLAPLLMLATNIRYDNDEDDNDDYDKDDDYDHDD